MINFEDVELFDCIYKKNLEDVKKETWPCDSSAHRWESDCHKIAVQWTMEDIENLVSKYLDEKYG